MLITTEVVWRSESVGLKRVADYWHSVIQINDYQKHRFVEMVISSMFNTVSGKKIAILGFAFKKVPALALSPFISSIVLHSNVCLILTTPGTLA